MKWWWSLLVIPTFLFAGLSRKGYDQLVEQSAEQERRAYKCIIELNFTCDLEKDAEKMLRLIDESILCWRKAKENYEIILKEIAASSFFRRYFSYRLFLKLNCNERKSNAIEQMKGLEEPRKAIVSKVNADKALLLYQQGMKKVNLAVERENSCIYKLDNTEEVVRILEEATALYDEGIAHFFRAIPLLSNLDDISFLKEQVKRYKNYAAECRKRGEGRAGVVAKEVQALKEREQELRGEEALFEGRGLARRVYEIQKERLSILNTLTKVSDEKRDEEIAQLLSSIERFEKQRDQDRLTKNEGALSAEEFAIQEKKRRELFFKGGYEIFLGQPLIGSLLAKPLEKVVGGNGENYLLYADKFYHFEVTSPSSMLHLCVYEEEKMVGEVRIPLPTRNSPSWKEYLANGLLLTSKEGEKFGLELRLHYNYHPFSLIITQRAFSTKYHYHFSFEEGRSLYRCSFIEPPPLQLGKLRTRVDKGVDRGMPPQPDSLERGHSTMKRKRPSCNSIPLLDSFVKEMKKNPIALAEYVQNEIDFVDPYLYQEGGVYHAPSIHRNIEETFLEKQGSPYEQCQLLAYLLREAGYLVSCIEGGITTFPSALFKKMARTSIEKDPLVRYPWLLLLQGDRWIPLFPWMKEMEMEEGEELYHHLPEQYGSAELWIRHYLEGDEEILKQIGPDEDDSVGSLFPHFVEGEMRKKGKSLFDLGRHVRLKKRSFHSWEQFPRPTIKEKGIPRPDFLQKNSVATIKICPQNDRKDSIIYTIPLVKMGSSFLQFSTTPEGFSMQFAQEPERFLKAKGRIDIAITYKVFLGSTEAHTTKTLSLDRGEDSVLAFHLGGASLALLTQLHKQLLREKQSLYHFLAFAATAYFEKCSRQESLLAALHKLPPSTSFAFGLVTLSPIPKMDMWWINPQQLQGYKHPISTNYRQFIALHAINTSSNEAQILREIFLDSHALSTCKLLQRTYQEQGKFLPPTPEMIEKLPAECKKLLEQNCDWSYIYLTSPTSDLPGAALILHPQIQYTLISQNSRWIHGGVLDDKFWKWWKFPYFFPKEFNPLPELPLCNPLPKFLPINPLPNFSSPLGMSSDVRLQHKSLWQSIDDPVDLITGSFYVDEADLILPGPFPLEIRRNYSSQNPLIGEFGHGWKLGLFPHLYKKEELLYASESDGTTIAYRWNPESKRWEVFAEDNAELYNFSQSGEQCRHNPFQAYIKDDILYGADGSKRYFNKGLLQKWENDRGNTLLFSYSEGRLSCIESHYGAFCKFLYDYKGRISEIYTRDGRWLSYHYNSLGELSQVRLPNGATISYEYDRCHRILRESRSHGTTIENHYDDQGRVLRQCSPMGLQQEMVATATFTYHDGKTMVTDGKGGTTTYKIFQKQIYSITDPLGYRTLFSWFIDDNRWFDPNTETILAWPHEGGAARSLKESKDKRGLTTTYLYDSSGNPTTITEKGDGVCRVTNYSYNSHNLCTYKECGQIKSKITYDSTHPHLIKKIEEYDREQQLSFYEYHYNAMGRVERENHANSITLWKYDDRGFPLQKTQLTNSADPDCVTHYIFNNRGECIEERRPDATERNSYDIMGNLLHTERLSPSGHLLAEKEQSFNLAGAPLWERAANPDEICYFEYNAAGLLTATAHTLTPGQEVAYTLYTYDILGNLIEKVDPLGYTTYREYDPLGRVAKEMRGESTTSLTYEAGGLLATITSPGGGKESYSYTANGLLKEVIYPDQTRKECSYDMLGRPIREKYRGIEWKIEYEGNKTTHTHLESNKKEVREFDGRGNLLTFTDLAGYTTKNSYDGLNRLTSTTTPSGKTTTWHYDKDRVICHLPSGEKRVERYEGEQMVESQTFSAQALLLESKTIHFDPKSGKKEERHGEEKRCTYFNTLGLPITITEGKSTTTYRYDLLGNCIAITDSEGRSITQHFDSHRRVVEKTLPDGATIEYRYDLDSNLTELLLPNGVVWSCSYDKMGRKIGEKLHSEGQSSQRWHYFYEEGYLKQSRDPLHRIHTYCYDSFGRTIEEKVAGWQRSYCYDPRGHLTSAEQSYSHSYLSGYLSNTPSQTRSRVERSYDGDGRLIYDSISCDDEKLYELCQSWTPSTRSLQIDNHQQTFTYQNNNLTHLSTDATELTYSYSHSGRLKRQTSPHTHRTLDYTPSSLPHTITTTLPSTTLQESLSWTPLDKLSTYTAPHTQLSFTYTKQGYLQSAGDQRYEFDFGDIGTGIRTAASHLYLPEKGALDPFDRVIKEITDTNLPLTTIYNQMGEVIFHNNTQYEWDPWGNLLSLSNATFTWRGEYDALGRRIRTSYHSTTEEEQTLHLYDPQARFREIGIQTGEKRYWKLNGPQGCDGVVDDYGNSAILIHNGLNQLLGVFAHDTFIPNQEKHTPYGPRGPPSRPHDLLSYAQSLSYRRQGADPTGLFWMGARYYDPNTGRFLSPDPVGHLYCLDLYSYANGDPVNYHDPDGYFFSHAYKPINPVELGWPTHTLVREPKTSSPILFINGIANSPIDFEGHMKYLDQYNGGKRINGVYNPTSGKVYKDVFYTFKANEGLHFPVVERMKSMWNTLLEQNPNRKILTICHSGGASHLKNALLASPEEVRQQIKVLAIAPSVIISKEICYDSKNYISTRDFVSFIDVEGIKKHGKELKRIKAHPDAELWDHSFQSPTFAKTIQKAIKAHIKEYGDKQ